MIIKMDFKKLLSMFLVLAIILGSAYLLAPDAQDESDAGIFASSTAEDSYIKWVDFDIPASLLEKAMNLDVETYEDETRAHIDWIELLAYLAVKCGGDFDKHKTSDYNTLVEKLEAGSTVSELADGMEHYDYYLEAYTAVLGGFLGEYEIQEGEDKTWTQQYGLKVFSPLADGYYFTHSDDFGNGRSYGYQRKHLGHDLMASIGTPVVAVESGVVEELGWNQYGGWRVGIRSFDGQRYYYYAHLRQNRPYAEGLEQGQVVMAGDVIGYVGRTGYSTVENTNGMQENHLHLGLQLIFDESQKDGVNEIWIDLYQLTLFLQNHKSQTWRDSETKEHYRVYEFKEAVPQNRFVPAEQEEEAGETASSQQVIRQETGVELPVLMYHDILNDPAKQGPYAITPAELEADLKYLQNNGYTAISIDDLIQYYEQQVPLPEKPVLLTFDDGHYNNIYYAQPLLEQYDMQAVAFIVGAYCDRAEEEQDENPNYSYVTWSRVQEMSQSGVWDIQSHTWNMHDLSAARQGVWQQSGESDAAYRQALTEDFTAITDKITEVTGTRPTAFAYPFGYLSDEAEEVLKSLGYKATFSCRESVSTIQPGQEDTMYNICRYLRASGISAQELLEQ